LETFKLSFTLGRGVYKKKKKRVEKTTTDPDESWKRVLEGIWILAEGAGS
jgi:hypothetical protein